MAAKQTRGRTTRIIVTFDKNGQSRARQKARLAWGSGRSRARAEAGKQGKTFAENMANLRNARTGFALCALRFARVS